MAMISLGPVIHQACLEQLARLWEVPTAAQQLQIRCLSALVSCRIHTPGSGRVHPVLFPGRENLCL